MESYTEKSNVGRPFTIVNNAEADPDWRWIQPIVPADDPLDWTFISAQKTKLERRLPGLHWGRIRAAWTLRRLIQRQQVDWVVSHGPYTSFYSGALTNSVSSATKHLAMSFNFTDLPRGKRFTLMQRAFEKIDRFAVYSTYEIGLYHEVFGIPKDKLDFVRWGVTAPITNPGPRTIESPYFAAVGGEARDYSTLCETARMMPNVKFVFIVRPTSLAGLSVPDNVDVRINLPWADTWTLMWHAEAALVSLRSPNTPNGHVTIVGGMHIGKCHVVTDSVGVADYVDSDTAFLVPAHDPAAFKIGIENVLDDPVRARAMGDAARVFAQTHCSEQVTVDYFRRVIGLT